MIKYIIKRLKKNKILLIMPILLFLCTVSTIYLSTVILKLNNIENFLRYMGVIFLVLLLIYILLTIISLIIREKAISIAILSFLMILLFSVECFGYSLINKVYDSINKISSNVTTYSSSLIALKESKINDVNNIKNKKIGIIEDDNSVDGHIIPLEIIQEKKLKDKNEIIEYENFANLLSGLYNKELDLIFVSSNYATLFSSIEGYESIKDETNVLYTMKKDKESENTSSKDVSEPFTILVMGVDSTSDDISSGAAVNGDALMLLTFNPKTFNATILSIPRDTYVPVMCFKNRIENKITHAAWYGESCMISTIENFTGIKIDYYLEINFKGVVKLVDALGGVSVDVPYSFCEQNSNREWGGNTVFVEKGYRKLNGEQALALARNRHRANDGTDVGEVMARFCPTYREGTRNDFVRAQNQQTVINAIINKAKDIKSINEIYALLDVVQKNIATSLSTDKMLSFYNIAKTMLLSKSNKNSDVVSFEHLYLDGHGQMIWDEGMGLLLWDYIYNRQSLKDIVKAMNVNLEKEEATMIKTFNFSINTEYEEIVIGKGPYKYEMGPNTVPNFVGDKNSQSYAVNWGNNNGITISVDTENVTDKNKNGIVIKQSLPSGYLVKNISSKKMSITVGKYTEPTEEKLDCSKDENKDNSKCLIPDFGKKTIEQARTWKNSLDTSIMVTINEIKITDDSYDLLKAGELKSQSVVAGTNISNVKEITITYYQKQE